jgi:predicted acetyltransferase
MGLLEPPAGRHHAYLFGPDAAPEGHVIYSQKLDATPYQIHIHDWSALTPAAAERLLAFFATHRSVVDSISLADAPSMPLLALVADPPVEMASYKTWMLRLTDVRSALAARGYPPDLAGELHLDVRDDLVSANSGRLVLAISNGRGEVGSGGKGDLGIDVRGLASLYTGFLTPADLVRNGMADGSPRALTTAAAAFAGPAPWMPDTF